MKFKIEFQASHVAQIMEAIRREVATPQQMLGSVGESLLIENQDRHKAGVDPDGNPWKELAESTKSAGPRKGGPLMRTGRMLRNLNYQVTSDSLRLGFDSGDGFPAIFHQDGSRPHVITAKKGKSLKFGGIYRKRVNHPGLPVRRLLGFPDSDQRLIADVLADHLSKVANKVR
ncbi:phage virion morphogenesis protein [Azonexus sp.]|uniref:phage virion morphogenesis protein n=1 Tax=Azonexus sp. TaxID=1872668 RepID=UPI0027BA23B1|nr:phage virion morphogenesis protein [Azonexus sp.]